ncbi:conjugal transfer protein [Mycobacterium sp. SM1]|uniref:conjugal transfer protein n=1 Tax=Mycobacterium sp. SM1 TaxID=2816243 RepID=UPI001BCED0CE|nr:conjugal transfer protein [Mycobacterium sp. SM1]MBS4730586.1 conjugal transfer protein [Mycobacterium sp. SM1]
MLTRSLDRFLDSLFLRIAGGDSIRADELRARATGSFLAFIMVSYIPLIVAVALLVLHRPHSVDESIERDQLTAVEAYAIRYVDTYLKDPSNTAAIKQFYDGEVPVSALPAGGRALRAASCLPGVFKDGFQTYSVVVDAEIPKAANAASTVAMKLQVDISADSKNLYRAFTLPHARSDRKPGRPVQLATQTLVSEDRPVYKTVSGFLAAMLTGQGDLTPYVAANSTLTAQQPPRFTTMAIERVQTNSEAATAQDVPPKADGIEVTVRAVMQTASGVLMPMDFPLVMSVAAGHWQVDRINDAPSIIVPIDSGPSGSTSTTSTTTTTTATPPRSYTTSAPEGS